MVKRLKNDDMAGVLEFEGRTVDDPQFAEWLLEHKARKGGKIHVAKGGTGVRVMFSKAADMVLWKRRSDQAGKTKPET